MNSLNKNKSKVQLNWEILKEQEKEFIKGIPKFINGIKTILFFKGIRQTEYRRGKEDAESSTFANLKGDSE